MLRAIGAVIGGYLAAAVALILSFLVAGTVMGTEQVFKPGSYAPSLRWTCLSFFLGFWAAALGGVVCAAIARRMSPVHLLAGLVLLLGVALAIPTLRERPDPGPRPAGPVDAGAARNAIPMWVAFSNPPIGAAGVCFGGWALLRKLGRRAGTM